MNLESPCNRVCTLDMATGLCIGCRRTMDEISRWAAMSDAERDAVRKDLPSRGPGWTAITCARCGATFACGAADREHPCWCASYPSVPAPAAGKGCFCPGCLSVIASKAHG